MAKCVLASGTQDTAVRQATMNNSSQSSETSIAPRSNISAFAFLADKCLKANIFDAAELSLRSRFFAVTGETPLCSADAPDSAEDRLPNNVESRLCP